MSHAFNSFNSNTGEAGADKSTIPGQSGLQNEYHDSQGYTGKSCHEKIKKKEIYLA